MQVHKKYWNHTNCCIYKYQTQSITQWDDAAIALSLSVWLLVDTSSMIIRAMVLDGFLSLNMYNYLNSSIGKFILAGSKQDLTFALPSLSKPSMLNVYSAFEDFIVV